MSQKKKVQKSKKKNFKQPWNKPPKLSARDKKLLKKHSEECAEIEEFLGVNHDVLPARYEPLFKADRGMANSLMIYFMGRKMIEMAKVIKHLTKKK